MPAAEMPATTQEVQTQTAEVSAEIETEMNNDVAEAQSTTDQPVESTESSSTEGNSSEQEPEQTAEAEPTEQEAEPAADNESTGDSGQPESNQSDGSEVNQDAQSAEPQQKPKAKVKVAKKSSAKQKAANKIVKKMGDKGRYDSTNQLKTLVIMNVLTDSKKFLVQPTIPQPTGFFSDKKMPDAQLPENNAAAWLLMGGSNQLHDALVDSQYK